MIGVDLGGTNVRAQAIWSDGSEAGARFEIPSRAQEGTERIIDALTEVVQQAVASADSRPVAVGLAIPGHIDDAAGLVRWAPNFGKTVDGVFRYWQDVPVKVPLAERLNLPIVMANDANAAAYGEYRFGSGEGKSRCLVLLTLGTGIGGGVVMAPSSVHGAASSPLLLLGGNLGGAELGHILIQHGGLDCNAGSYGALEAYCQRDAIARRATHKLRRGRKSNISSLVEGDLGAVTPHTIFEAAEAGDEVAIEVLAETGEMLGAGIGTLINVFAPDVLAVGGQVAKAGEWILGPARKAAEAVAIPSLFADATIRQAEQIDDAGLLGAAALAMESTQ